MNLRVRFSFELWWFHTNWFQRNLIFLALLSFRIPLCAWLFAVSSLSLSQCYTLYFRGVWILLMIRIWHLFYISIKYFSLTHLHAKYPWITLYLWSYSLHLSLIMIINIWILILLRLHYKNVLLNSFCLWESLHVFILLFLFKQ